MVRQYDLMLLIDPNAPDHQIGRTKLVVLESRAYASGRGQHPVPSWPPEPTVLTLQDLLDIPRQILPEETYFHLKNAGREAVLAVLSLANSINNARRASGSGKTRKHINVE